MYISCTDPSCHNWVPDFLLVRQNSFTAAYPMNWQNKLVWQLGSVHKIHIHLEATSPFYHFCCFEQTIADNEGKRQKKDNHTTPKNMTSVSKVSFPSSSSIFIIHDVSLLQGFPQTWPTWFVQHRYLNILDKNYICFYTTSSIKPCRGPF